MTLTQAAGPLQQRERPLRVGVVLSGGQAPGGHNVITGVFDYAKRLHPDSEVIGFLDGPHGVFSNRYIALTAERLAAYRNSGGFDIIGAGRHKIESPEQFAQSLASCTALGLDGLLVIGGDDSNTNAAVLAEYFKSQGSPVSVCGAPKTIDGDMKVWCNIACALLRAWHVDAPP
jgi:pyrophosphate--fructose-6-phosphate 1-phosphotransferase